MSNIHDNRLSWIFDILYFMKPFRYLQKIIKKSDDYRHSIVVLMRRKLIEPFGAKEYVKCKIFIDLLGTLPQICSYSNHFCLNAVQLPQRLMYSGEVLRYHLPSYVSVRTEFCFPCLVQQILLVELVPTHTQESKHNITCPSFFNFGSVNSILENLELNIFCN